MEKTIGKEKNKKIVIIISFIVILFALIAVMYIKVWDRNPGYRAIKITEVSGTVTYMDGEGKSYEAIENMNLESGCSLSTDSDSYVVLRLDDDKYVMLEEKSAINLYAESNKDNGKTKIELIDGSVLNEIQNHLSEDATYDVKTPGATMSVRGTVFEVTYDAKSQETRLCVYDGKVAVGTGNGESGDEALYEAGEYTQFVEKDGNIEYIVERDSITEDMISPLVLKRLQTISDGGREIIFEHRKTEETKKDSPVKPIIPVKKEDTETGKKLVVTSNRPNGTSILAVNPGTIPNPSENPTPSSETPSTETPSSETPSSETPSSETPATETPSSESPSSETPSSETPNSETPATETPSSESPSTETPSSETPSTEEPSSEEPTGNWLHLAVPVVVDSTEVYCTISESSCTVSTTLGDTGKTLTAPTQFWGYGQTFASGETITPSTETPTLSMLNTSSSTLAFSDWMMINNTALSPSLTNGSLLVTDNVKCQYYSVWVRSDNVMYYPVEIVSGTNKFYINVPSGTKIYVNGTTQVTSIYNALSITAQ